MQMKKKRELIYNTVPRQMQQLSLPKIFDITLFIANLIYSLLTFHFHHTLVFAPL